MEIDSLKSYDVPDFIIGKVKAKGILKLNPAQVNTVKAGLFEDKNMIVCTPTGSGKTLLATFLISRKVKRSKVIYLVPLKALANEKLREYTDMFKETDVKVAMSTGDFDSGSSYLNNYDLIIMTIEKLDSLLRHKAEWILNVRLLVVDEIHLLNDVSRGPALEFVITMLRKLLKDQIRILGLSATIGNPKELADWLDANVIVDYYRPVKLKKGIYLEGDIEFYE